MTPRQDRTDVGQRFIPPRLRLKPRARTSGHVDGAWWPRSNDLAAELPDLLAVLSVRLGSIDRVLYNVNEWAKSSAQLATGRPQVRLDGYRRQPTSTIEVLGVNRSKTVLLVVPPNTDPDKAHATLMAAAAPSNGSTVDCLLMVSAREREILTQAADAQERWESAGKQCADRDARAEPARSLAKSSGDTALKLQR